MTQLDNKNEPLVSVVVITYNSAKTIVETLDSIKEQTYQNLDLIISDDCSKDKTVKICKKWIGKNKDRFHKSKIIISERNTGIPGNMNRGIDACETELCKTIAGDDMLLPKCIEEYVNYISEHRDAVVVFSRVVVFGPSLELEDKVEKLFDYSFFRMSPEEQYKRLVFDGNCVPAATQFLNVKRLHELGIKFDERIPLLEDYPFLINLTKNDVKLHFLDKKVVRYRIGSGLTTSGSIGLNYSKSLRLFELYYRFPEFYKINPEDEIRKIVDYERFLIYEYEIVLNSFSYKLGCFLLKPYKWILKYL